MRNASGGGTGTSKAGRSPSRDSSLGVRGKRASDAGGKQTQGGRSSSALKSRSVALPAAIPVSSVGGDGGSGAAGRQRKPALPARRSLAKAGATAGPAAAPSQRRAGSTGQSRAVPKFSTSERKDTRLPASAFVPKPVPDSYLESSESKCSRQMSDVSSSLPDQPEHPELTSSRRATFESSEQEDNIKVCIRLRPLNASETQKREKKAVTCSMTNANVIHLEQKGVQNSMNRNSSTKGSADLTTMTFDWVLNETVSQAEVYSHLGERLVQGVIDGFHGCVFAYGQTGSGKSHTIFGGSGEEKGLVPRISNGLFQFLQRDSEEASEYIVRLSYLELYNEKARDLLNPDAEQDGKELEIRQHPRVGVFVDGLTSNVVTGVEDVNRLLQFGHKIRIVGCTNMNVVSSRSHAVVTMQVERTIPAANGERVKRRAQLHSVDLAGSERHSATQGTCEARVSESKNINKSLSALSLMISKLANKHESRGASVQHIPFRNSKLTYLLSDSLMGNCRTAMLACASPAESSLSMTESTLRFACSVKSIRTQPVKNEEIEGDLVKVLRSEIESLRSALKNGSPGDEDLNEKLKISQTLAESFGMSAQELTAKTKALEHEREQALQSLGVIPSTLAQAWKMGDDDVAKKIASDAQPYLVNVCDDPLLSGCLMYTLPKGAQVHVGSDEDCRVQIDGLGVQPHMCTLVALDEKSVEVRVASTQQSVAGLHPDLGTSLKGRRMSLAATMAQNSTSSDSEASTSSKPEATLAAPILRKSVVAEPRSKPLSRRQSTASSRRQSTSSVKSLRMDTTSSVKSTKSISLVEPEDSSSSDSDSVTMVPMESAKLGRRCVMASEDENRTPVPPRRVSLAKRRASLWKSGIAEVFVNSKRLTRSEQLRHGDRIRVGRTHVFQLFIPQSADQSKRSANELASGLTNERDSGQQILVKEYASHLQERIGIERAAKVFHALLELQPLVEEANDLTEELRGGEDELNFKAHVLTDVLSVDEDPELTVALRRVAQDQEQDLSKLKRSPDEVPRSTSTLLAVWSLAKFQQRLEVMRDLYQEVCDRDKPWGEAEDADPWREDRGAPLVGSDVVKASSRCDGESQHPEEPDAEPHDGEVRDMKMAARLSDLEQQLALAKNDLAKRDEQLRGIVVQKEFEDLMSEREIGARAIQHLSKLQARLGGAEERVTSLQTQLGLGPNESTDVHLMATPTSSTVTDSPSKPAGVVAPPVATSPPLVCRRSLSPALVTRCPNVIVSPGHQGVSSCSPQVGGRSLSPPRARTVSVGVLRSASGAAARSLSPEIAPRSLSPPIPMHALARHRSSSMATPQSMDSPPLQGRFRTTSISPPPLGQRRRSQSFPSLLTPPGPLLPPTAVPQSTLLMTKAQVGAPLRRTLSDRHLQGIEMAHVEACLSPEPASVTLKCTPSAASRPLQFSAPAVALQPASTATALQFAPAMAPSLTANPPPPLSIAVPVRDGIRSIDPNLLPPAFRRHVQAKARARSEEAGPCEVRTWQSEIHREMARLRQDIASLGKLLV